MNIKDTYNFSFIFSNSSFYLLEHWNLCFHDVYAAVLDLATHTLTLGRTVVIAFHINLYILTFAEKIGEEKLFFVNF